MPLRTIPSTHIAAEQYHESGLYVFPISVDGTRTPLIKWGGKQATKPKQVSHLFATRDCGIAIATGKASGNLEVLDFDDAMSFCSWLARVTGNSPDLRDVIRTLPIVRSPRPSAHVYYRLHDVPRGNQILARSEDGKVLIETRGQGGFVVAPSGHPQAHKSGKPYTMLQGNLCDIPIITPHVRECFVEYAAMLNRYTLSPSACSPLNRKVQASSTNQHHRAYKWLQKIEPAIDGQGGNRQTLYVAQRLVLGFDLTTQEALDVMQDWNSRCEPPWSDNELLAKLQWADTHTPPYRYGGQEHHNRGYML